MCLDSNVLKELFLLWSEKIGRIDCLWPDNSWFLLLGNNMISHEVRGNRWASICLLGHCLVLLEAFELSWNESVLGFKLLSSKKGKSLVQLLIENILLILLDRDV